MSKDSRAGGKFCGSHTTCIPMAATIADIAHACPLVTKIHLGYITAGMRPAKGLRRVKISGDPSTRSIMLSIRDNTSFQELRVYVSNLHEAQKVLKESIETLKGITCSIQDAV